MTCCVFLGPTLPAAEAAAALDAVILPPVRQGDILRLVQADRPRAIGIIDGYFRAVPACWHKEILFALSEGVHVFGAASMGALRAAELDGFGMVGVGRIYRAYQAGTFPPFDGERFEDDDEVAVVHGPAETGYVAASEAMVNIRATLDRAADLRVIQRRSRDALAAIAKALPFSDRCYPRLLAAAGAEHQDGTDLGALEAWLPDGRIDLKRADALEMLGAMRAFLEADPAPHIAEFRLEASAAWRAALLAPFEFATTDVDRIDELVLDEARLAASAGDRECRRAVERLAALQAALRRGVDANEPLRRAMLDHSARRARVRSPARPRAVASQPRSRPARLRPSRFR